MINFIAIASLFFNLVLGYGLFHVNSELNDIRQKMDAKQPRVMNTHSLDSRSSKTQSPDVISQQDYWSIPEGQIRKMDPNTLAPELLSKVEMFHNNFYCFTEQSPDGEDVNIFGSRYHRDGSFEFFKFPSDKNYEELSDDELEQYLTNVNVGSYSINPSELTFTVRLKNSWPGRSDENNKKETGNVLSITKHEGKVVSYFLSDSTDVIESVFKCPPGVNPPL